MELSNDITAFKDFVLVLLRRIEVLESENVVLRALKAELRLRLNLNSKNSHKPPSTGGMPKKPDLPKDSTKKIGKQFGHKVGVDVCFCMKKQCVAYFFSNQFILKTESEYEG